MKLYIPITQTLFTNTDTHIWNYLNYIKHCGSNQFYNMSDSGGKVGVCITYFDRSRKNKLRDYLGVSRTTFDAWWKTTSDGNLIISDDNIAFLEVDAWERFAGWCLTMPPKSRNMYARLFCCIVFNDAYYNGDFQITQELLAAKLGLTRNSVLKPLKELVAAGFVIRYGSYSFTGAAHGYHYKMADGFHAVNPFENLW